MLDIEEYRKQLIDIKEGMLIDVETIDDISFEHGAKIVHFVYQHIDKAIEEINNLIKSIDGE